MNFIKKSNQAGFSILFATLISSLVLSIGIAILSITLKQITLASAGRESQRAFYAADTGLEFAMFLDRGGGNENCPNGIFPAPGDEAEGSEDPGDICYVKDFAYTFGGVTLNWDDINGVLNQTTEFTPVDPIEPNSTLTKVSVTSDNVPNSKICFDIFVTKVSDDGGQTVETKIESRGYSTCNETSSNRFERAIKAEF